MMQEVVFRIEEAYMELKKALLVGVNLGDGTDFKHSMKELSSLAEACNMEVVGSVVQNLPNINKGLYIGSGKVSEVKEQAELLEATVIIFDNVLAPMQLRNLQQEMELEVIDRTALILDIFSSRAQTKEAKMQVEIARLQYMLPRLAGLRTSLGRQGGGSGLSNKGAGEKKIELDKRRIEHRISELSKELETISKERQTQRKQRMQSGIPRVALVGYTNSGKSTLLNAMMEEFMDDNHKLVLEKDMLFATLDTTVRKIMPKNHKPFLLSDTVGFIERLPHNLIKAFRSTLEEAKYADLLVEVIDFSDEHYKEHMKVTEQTLNEIGAKEVPIIYLFNKADLLEKQIPTVGNDSIYMSAKSRIGLEELIRLMEVTLLKDYLECDMLLPYSKGNLLAILKESADVKQIEYETEGIRLHLNCKKEDYNKYEKYVCK